MKKSMKDKVIIALDFSDLRAVRKILGQLEGLVTFYKIGLELFSAYGWRAVDLVKKSGARVFLDLKLHDIPTTVAKTARVLAEHEVDMFNVHALGGLEMMRRTREAVDECAGRFRPKLLGVTILTSHKPEDLPKEMGIERPLKEEVQTLAALAGAAGLDGVVSSPEEIRLLRRQFPKTFLIVTPGIRPPGSNVQDQKRVMDARGAFDSGASYIVIGRPVTQALEPRQVVENLLSIESF